MQKRKIKTRRSIINRLLCALMATVIIPVLISSTVYAGEIDAMSGKKPTFRYKDTVLCPGGMTFGVKIFTEGVLIVGLSSFKGDGKEYCPASEAGLKPRDIILSANGNEVNKVEEVSKFIAHSGGKTVTFKIKRDGTEKDIEITPQRSDEGGYKAGMWLRDSTAGIGTVTFVDPEGKSFGGLGHGICDVDTGVLMPLRKGTALGASIGGVNKGKSGRPGELKGYFKPEKFGSIEQNTDCGVFGVYAEMPENVSKPIPVGSRDELREGKAEILCTLGDDGIGKYEIKISKIDRDSTDNKSFMITVTDPELKARTGGIVQGMSGSPVIQDGKLVGAVTHVMVSDPETGYGVFIENMLDVMSE